MRILTLRAKNQVKILLGLATFFYIFSISQYIFASSDVVPVSGRGSTKVVWIELLKLKLSGLEKVKIKDKESGVDRELSVADKEKIDHFFNDVIALLPPQMKDKLADTFQIKFTQMDKLDYIPIEIIEGRRAGEKSQVKFGECNYKRKSIKLNKNFLPHILQRGEKGKTSIYDELSGKTADKIKEDFPSRHKTFYRTAVATLVHELVHQYFHKNPLTKIEEEHFDNLVHWRKTGLIFNTRQLQNVQNSRSPDPYANESIDEAKATLFEYFLLDKEFKCRMPLQYNFFSMHFKITPFEDFVCADKIKNTVKVMDPITGVMSTVALDPSRIYQVRYLLADKGDEGGIVSGWGHSMYHLVICAPESEFGPECESDFKHHLVVNFGAEVPTGVINFWDGLVGNYKSVVTVSPFLTVKENYNELEDRDLISLPLDLKADEIRDFANRVLELKYTYNGEYLFLSNNCAVEALALLKSAVLPRIEELKDRYIRTPTALGHKWGLYGLLKDEKIKLMDDGVLQDKEKSLWHVFKSSKVAQEKSFDFFKNVFASNKVSMADGESDGKFPFLTLEDYLSSTADQRYNLYKKLYYSTDIELIRKKITMYYLKLENLILKKNIKKYMSEAAKKLHAFQSKSEDTRTAEENAFIEANKRMLELLELRDNDGLLLTRGYGIPLERDYESSKCKLDRDKDKDKDNLDLQIKSIKNLIEHYLDSQFEEISDEIKKSKKYFFEVSALFAKKYMTK